MLHIHTAHPLPCFFIFSPPVWDGICRTARHGCLNTLQPPFTPQLSPDAAPAAVFSGRGIIITRSFKAACQRCPMPGMPLIFFLHLLRSLVPPASKSCHILLSRQIFLREALPSSSSNVPDVLCPYILIFRSGR